MTSTFGYFSSCLHPMLSFIYLSIYDFSPQKPDLGFSVKYILSQSNPQSPIIVTPICNPDHNHTHPSQVKEPKNSVHIFAQILSPIQIQ